MGFIVSKDRVNEKTGLTADFINELTELSGLLDFYTPTISLHLAEQYAPKNIVPLLKYTERYDQKEFPELITLKNERRICRVNTLVDEINRHLQQETTDVTIYKALAGRICFLVRGDYHIAPKNELHYDFKKHKK